MSANAVSSIASAERYPVVDEDRATRRAPDDVDAGTSDPHFGRTRSAHHWDTGGTEHICGGLEWARYG